MSRRPAVPRLRVPAAAAGVRYADGLAVVESALGLRVEACMKGTPKPGPCKRVHADDVIEKIGKAVSPKKARSRVAQKPVAVPKAAKVAPARPKAARPVAKPKRGASRVGDLLSRAQHLGSLGEPSSSRRVGGGQVAEAVELRSYPDGTRAIRKRASDNDVMGWRMTAKQQSDAEELASLVGASLGLNVPAVHREDEGTVLMDFMDGDVAVGLPAAEGTERYFDIPEDTRARVGLFDALIDNRDRHKGNFLFTADNDPALIDHGLAWQFERGDGVKASAAPQLREFGGSIASAGEYVENKFSKKDMDQVRQRLEGLRPQFERLGRGSWLDESLTRLDGISQHARGKKDLMA